MVAAAALKLISPNGELEDRAEMVIAHSFGHLVLQWMFLG